jgi:hypothetical protein
VVDGPKLFSTLRSLKLTEWGRIDVVICQHTNLLPTTNNNKKVYTAAGAASAATDEINRKQKKKKKEKKGRERYI